MKRQSQDANYIKMAAIEIKMKKDKNSNSHLDIVSKKNNFSMSKRSQLQIQEMAFMLVAVIFFFVLAGLFVASIMYSNVHEQATDIAETRTLTSVTNLADSPEFSCVLSKSNCVDEDKLISLINSSYKNFWSFSSLRVVKLNAFNKDEKEMIQCTRANYPECDLFVIYNKNVENERSISSYVALCRKEYENGYTYDKCELARLVAGTELKPISAG